MHSLYSDDGEFTVKELVDLCVLNGVKIMSICDHNSAKASKEAREYASSKGINYINGIEIDCVFNDINLHVLGLGINDNQVFLEIEHNIHKQELESSDLKLELTNQLGFNLEHHDMKKVSSDGVYTGEMFAEVLLENPMYYDVELLKPYREGGSRSDNPLVNFYWDFYSKDKPCFTELELPSLEEIIEVIHSNNGVAILAHPGKNLDGKFELFEEMVNLGLDGVEAFSSYHTEEVNQHFYQKSKELGVMYTVGSDYHGKTKPAINLGEMGFDKVDELELLLKERKLI
jgi:predicted metal-dependent phosphoesterase TrpH